MQECKNCKTELTEMKNDKGEVTCLRCLKCNPITAYVPPVDRESKYVDKPWTDERVIEVIDRIVPDMIREVLENWHIQKPSVGLAGGENVVTELKTELKPDTWRTKAKKLGIELYDKVNSRPRLKTDVLAEIAEKTTEKTNVPKELQTQE